MWDLPVSTKLQLPSGVPADGRTLRLVHVSEQVTPPLLAEVTVKVRFDALTVVIATDVPLAMPLMFNEFAPLPKTRVMMTAGSGAVVAKTNPAGAFKMMVPAPMLPLWSSG